MLVNLDAKALEWVCAAYLSQDKVAIQELVDNVDVHSSNQQRFGLPDRLTAKVYLFRLIYGGSAYSYSVDPDFADVSDSPKFWERVIDATYDKYRGLNAWHTSLMKTVVETGKLTMPTGRTYTFKPSLVRGERTWPRTTILNYPVQGLGADVMALIRVHLSRYLKKTAPDALLVCTVHDSVLIDTPEEQVGEVVKGCYQVFNDFPTHWKKLFGSNWNVPLRTEVQVGENWGQMEDVTEEMYAN